MPGGRAVAERSTPTPPPMAKCDEAEPGQPDTARAPADAYGQALRAMEEDGAAVTTAGDLLVALVPEHAQGSYAPGGHGLVWREVPEDANAHIEVAVADGADGRFVPELDVAVTVLDGDVELFRWPAPFLWHPVLHHYGFTARLPGEGPYTVIVEIEPPWWMRHDPVNGKRYAEAVEVVFEDVFFTLGRKANPGARPRGPGTPCAR